MSFNTKLSRDLAVPVPPDSARIDGFPYLSRRDLASYRAWRAGDDSLRPPHHVVLDRFPVSTVDVLGAEITGQHEEAIYDSDGVLHTLVPHQGASSVVQDHPEAGGSLRYLLVHDGDDEQLFAVHDDQPYQVVYLDYATLDAAGAR